MFRESERLAPSKSCDGKHGRGKATGSERDRRALCEHAERIADAKKIRPLLIFFQRFCLSPVHHFIQPFARESDTVGTEECTQQSCGQSGLISKAF